ncbi:MAG: hypothetical protein GXO27_02500 [Chlorobi bacterium]|nr:hypothetical protein [Chlorobiota bacterium]
MNLAERYKKLKSKANRLLREGLVHEYVKILAELTRVESKLLTAMQAN